MQRDIFETCDMLDNFINEEELQDFIEEEQSLQKLTCFLDLKYKRIQRNISQRTDFSVCKILNNKGQLSIEKKNALKLALLCQATEGEVTRCLNWFRNKLEDIGTCEDMSEILYVSEVLIDYRNLISNEFSDHKWVERLKKWIFKITELKLNCISYVDVPSIFVQYLDVIILEETNFMNEALYHLIKMENLDFLTILIDQRFFVLASSSLFQSPDLWCFLRNVVNNKNHTKKKQALYIIYKSIEFLKSHGNVSTPNALKAESFEVWDLFFILFELSEEKQLHLLKPALKLLKPISQINFDWQICLYKVLLQHSQLYVVYKTIQHILVLEVQEDTCFRELTKMILEALNKYDYSDIGQVVYKKLSDSCKDFNEFRCYIFFEEFSDIDWNPAAAWYILKSVAIIIPNVSDTLLFKIIKTLSSLPHLFIKYGCVIFFLFKFCYVTSYSIMEKLWRVGNILLSKNKKEYDEIFQILVEKNMDKLNISEIKNRISSIVAESDEKKFLIYSKILKASNEILVYDLKLPVSKIKDILLLHFPEISSENSCMIYIKQKIKECRNNYEDYSALLDMTIVSDNSKKIILKYFEDQNLLGEKTYNAFNLWLRHFEISHDSYYTEEDIIELVNILEEMLKADDEEILILVILNLNPLIQYGSIELISSKMYIFDECLKKIRQQKNALLRQYSREYFKSILHVKMFNNEKFIAHLKNNGEDFFRVDCEVLMKEILQKCKELILLKAPNIELVTPIILLAMKSGTVVSKNQRVEYEVCQDLGTYIGRVSLIENPNHVLADLKMLSMECLYLLAKKFSSENNIEKVDELVLEILDLYKTHKTRYFPDSRAHFEKLRIAQALLLISPFIGNSKAKLVETILDSFSQESHQHSVKQLLQWLLTILLESMPSDKWQGLIEVVNSASLTHPSSVGALIPVLYHLVISSENKMVWLSYINALTPWTMGANFKLRLYAQIALVMFFKKLKERGHGEFLAQFVFLEEAIVKTLQDAGKTIQETMNTDLIFNESFDPKLHFCIENIFITLPKSLGVASSEWKNISEYGFSDAFDIEIKNVHLAFPEISKTHEDIEREIDDSFDGTNVQKKIVPWKSALEDNISNKTLGDLICVASLVEKHSNLGGLSRTCEVFSVKQLVVHNAKIRDDKEFKNLSMSSENWVNLMEVKKENIVEFLSTMKCKGYVLVGLEQTSESVKLNKFKFQKKSVLLLGNEKAGIPAPLLPLLDFCVEIPQFGKTRSLNVHVAGATFIWEYVRQQILNCD